MDHNDMNLCDERGLKLDEWPWIGKNCGNGRGFGLDERP